MDFTKLPTDNFYIFISVGGLALIVFFSNMILKRISELRDTIRITRETVLKLKSKVEFSKLRIRSNSKKLLLQKELFYQKYNSKYELIDDENEIKMVFPENLKKEKLTEEYLEDYMKIKKTWLDQSEEFANQTLEVEVLQLYVPTLREKMKQLLAVSILGGAFILIGLLISSFGFISWYSKYQIYQDELLKMNYNNTLKQGQIKFMESKVDSVNLLKGVELYTK